MKKIFKVISIALSLCFIGLSLFAADKTTCIYYGNGIQNTYSEAKFSIDVVEFAYSSLAIDENFEFKVAYNESHGFIADIVEVIDKKVEETGGLTSDQLFEFVKLTKSGVLDAVKKIAFTSGGGKIVVDLAVEAVNHASDVYIDFIKENAQELSKYTTEVTLTEHIQQYISTLREGKRIIVVAHSQGNLFANDSIEEIIINYPEFENSIGIIGVGNPAGRVIGNNRYITADDDRVINALRITHEVLPANIDNDLGWGNDDPRDFFNHSFLWSYFLIPPSRARIDEMFETLTATLDYPVADIPVIGNVLPASVRPADEGFWLNISCTNGAFDFDKEYKVHAGAGIVLDESADNVIAEFIDEFNIRVFVHRVLEDTEPGMREVIVRYGESPDEIAYKEKAFLVMVPPTLFPVEENEQLIVNTNTVNQTLTIYGTNFFPEYDYGYYVYAGDGVHLKDVLPTGNAKATVSEDGSQITVVIERIANDTYSGMRDVKIRYGEDVDDVITLEGAIEVKPVI